MKIMQGDSYPIYIELSQDGAPLLPEVLDELEICVGEAMRKIMSDGGVQFDEDSNRWYIHPTQQETFALDNGRSYEVQARVHYKNSAPEQVIGVPVGRIQVDNAISEAVI